MGLSGTSSCLSQVLLLVSAVCATLVLAAHLLFWRSRSLHDPRRCAASSQLSGSLDKSLLESIHTLRYEEAVLEAERDKLLGISFSQARDLGRTTLCFPAKLCVTLPPLRLRRGSLAAIPRRQGGRSHSSGDTSAGARARLMGRLSCAGPF